MQVSHNYYEFKCYVSMSVVIAILIFRCCSFTFRNQSKFLPLKTWEKHMELVLKPEKNMLTIVASNSYKVSLGDQVHYMSISWSRTLSLNYNSTLKSNFTKSNSNSQTKKKVEETTKYQNFPEEYLCHLNLSLVKSRTYKSSVECPAGPIPP